MITGYESGTDPQDNPTVQGDHKLRLRVVRPHWFENREGRQEFVMGTASLVLVEPGGAERYYGYGPHREQQRAYLRGEYFKTYSAPFPEGVVPTTHAYIEIDISKADFDHLDRVLAARIDMSGFNQEYLRAVLGPDVDLAAIDRALLQKVIHSEDAGLSPFGREYLQAAQDAQQYTMHFQILDLSCAHNTVRLASQFGIDINFGFDPTDKDSATRFLNGTGTGRMTPGDLYDALVNHPQAPHYRVYVDPTSRALSMEKPPPRSDVRPLGDSPS